MDVYRGSGQSQVKAFGQGRGDSLVDVINGWSLIVDVLRAVDIRLFIELCESSVCLLSEKKEMNLLKSQVHSDTKAAGICALIIFGIFMFHFDVLCSQAKSSSTSLAKSCFYACMIFSTCFGHAGNSCLIKNHEIACSRVMDAICVA